jgi:hypothetical protein
MNMIIFWAFISLLVLILILSFLILNNQNRRVEGREKALKELFWKRRNAIPLILDVILKSAEGAAASQGKQFFEDHRNQLIELRAQSSTGAFTLPEQVEVEKQINHLIGETFQAAESDSVLGKESFLTSLRQEDFSVLEHLRIAINDYNYEFERFKQYCRWPTFAIFGFLFKNRLFKTLPNL